MLGSYSSYGRHHPCGQVTRVEPHCAACGEILHSADVDVEPGPGLAAGAGDSRDP